MCTHAPGASVPRTEELQGTAFRELGAGLGMMLIFSLCRVAGEGRGVFAMRVGVGHAAPHVMGMRRPCRAAAGSVLPAGMRLVTPGPARSRPAKPRGPSRGAGPTSPMQRGPSSAIPLCPQRGTGVLPLPAALPVAGATAATLPLHSYDLWMFAHSCLLMCLITKSCWDGALLPPAPAGLLSPFPGWESAPSPCQVGAHASQRSENKSPAHAQPAMSLLGAMGIPPLDTSEPKMLTELPGQTAVASPIRAWGKGAPFWSRAALPSAARLAHRLPVRRQAKFFAISRSTPAARNAPEPSHHPHQPPAQQPPRRGWEGSGGASQGICTQCPHAAQPGQPHP